MTLSNSQNKIAVEGRVFHSCRAKTGLRQRNLLSTLLFHLVLETAFRDSEIQTQRIIYQRKNGNSVDSVHFNSNLITP